MPRWGLPSNGARQHPHHRAFPQREETALRDQANEAGTPTPRLICSQCHKQRNPAWS